MKKKFKDTKFAGFFKNTAIGKTLTSVAIGTISGVPYVGKGISDELRANKSDKITGDGKHNIWRWIAFIVSTLLFLGRLIFPEVVNAELIANVAKIMSEAQELMN